MNLRKTLDDRISAALAAAGAAGAPALVGPAGNPKFGDYQANGVMAAAKRAKANPRQLAQKVLDAAAPALAEVASKVEIAGPGFINITLKAQWLAERLAAVQTDDHLGVERAVSPQTVVVDYSAPNLAKEMHVGHLRSTIIGDCLARVLDFVGHKVVRQNHVGDWGTQFGMLVAYYDRKRQELNTKIDKTMAQSNQEGFSIGSPNQPISIDSFSEDIDISDLEKFYREAKALFDADPAFAQLSRAFVVSLQQGNQSVRTLWRSFLEKSMAHCEKVYEKIGVLLTRDDIRGESAYNDDLPGVIADLTAKGMIEESKGAQCVFLPEFVGKDGERLPLIVQKSDEGYLYATTDLAGIRYRVGTLHANRILYVVDVRQSLHFRMVFTAARMAGFVPEAVSLEHVGFGTMMGADGKPFKTRTGGTVKLMDLLSEGVDKARELVNRKNLEDVEKGRTSPLSDEQKGQIAQAVGIGAVKYADLSQNRTSDYVFAWEKMLSLDGNTAPYMQYAFARILSIFRKENLDSTRFGDKPLQLPEPSERSLAVRLMQFPEAIAMVAAECMPNVLCAYLYELAGAFTTFYENCPVLKSDEPVRTSRLALCDLTARVIHTGLELLGIQTIEQM